MGDMTGLGARGVFTFMFRGYAETISVEKELQRIKDNIEKLNGSVTAATWNDIYDVWRIFIDLLSKLKHKVAIETTRNALSLKAKHPEDLRSCSTFALSTGVA